MTEKKTTKRNLTNAHTLIFQLFLTIFPSMFNYFENK